MLRRTRSRRGQVPGRGTDPGPEAQFAPVAELRLLWRKKPANIVFIVVGVAFFLAAAVFVAYEFIDLSHPPIF